MRPCLIGVLLVPVLLVSPSGGQWIAFDDETSTRLTLSIVPTNDPEEKDVAVADFDKDGDDDVIVVRKVPFSNAGPRVDVLLMNENGVLVDRTATKAPAFDDNPTDARDVVVADFDGDGWDDVIIANTFHQQPAYYINGRLNLLDDWAGLKITTGRIPFLAPAGQNPGPGPLFCAVSAGDVDGDTDLDVFFSNYNPGGTGTVDVLLINDGNGFFTDETTARMGSYANVAFGSGNQIVDINNDTFNDIVKISTLFNVPPFNDIGVFILFNDGNGVFDTVPFQKPPTEDEYMFVVDHLNTDDMYDMYVVEDPQDKVTRARGINGNGTVDWGVYTLSGSPRTASFGGNTHFADIDYDGDLDVGVAPVDVDIQNCTGGSAGEFALLQNDGAGILSDPWGPDQNIHIRPHDFAFMRVNDDECPDIFMALCTGYAVFIQTNCPATDVGEVAGIGAAGMELHAEPNPASGSTRLVLAFDREEQVPVSVRIYDVRGSLVRSVWSGFASDAPGHVSWDGRNDAGRPVPSGVYLARLIAGTKRTESKVLMVR